MKESIKEFAATQTPPPADENNSFSQYLSFHFYKENLDHFSNITKDSINNFLKTISEIEDEFVTVLKGQHLENPGSYSIGFENAEPYMEENY